MRRSLSVIFVAVGLSCQSGAFAQPSSRPAARAPAPAPGSLPGKGLAQHPFLYAGQWDTRNPVETLFLVRDGKVV